MLIQLLLFESWTPPKDVYSCLTTVHSSSYCQLSLNYLAAFKTIHPEGVYHQTLKFRFGLNAWNVLLPFQAVAFFDEEEQSQVLPGLPKSSRMTAATRPTTAASSRLFP